MPSNVHVVFIITFSPHRLYLLSRFKLVLFITYHRFQGSYLLSILNVVFQKTTAVSLIEGV